MKRVNRFWLTGVCAIGCLLGAAHWLRSVPVQAQQNYGDSDDGNIYVYAWIDIDSSYILYTESYTVLDYFADENIDAVDDEMQVDEDQDVFFDHFADPDYYYSEYPPEQSNGPVDTGHEYGVTSIGWVCYDYGDDYGEGDGEGDDCYWYPELAANAPVYVQAPPPRIYGITPSSAHQGDQGTLTLTGADFIENSTDQLTLNFSGSSNPFMPASAPSSNTASFYYDFSGYPTGTYTLSVTNNEATSDNVFFTVLPAPSNQAPVADPCGAVATSNPQVGFTSVVPTGTAGGSGTLAVSFSGAAFAAVSPSVTYGPYSTPSSIAANLAALITKQYFQYGLSAKAFGPYIVYSGNTDLGIVSNVITGPSIGTDPSSTAAAAAETACHSAPQVPNTQETTVVAWINGNIITLPSGASAALQAVFPSPSLGGPWSFGSVGYIACLAEVAALTSNSLGVASNTISDTAYANAWLLKYSGNQDPGKIITPSTFTSSNYQYRLFADYSPSQGIHTTSIGYTPDPCGTPLAYVQGVAYSQNGHYTGDSNGTGTSQGGYNFLLAETRVGSAGQAGWKTLNNNQEIPWVWSVIEFNQSGYPVGVQNSSATSPTTNYQLFPTYSVYFNGSRVYETHQGTPAGFAALPPGQSLTQSSIQ